MDGATRLGAAASVRSSTAKACGMSCRVPVPVPLACLARFELVHAPTHSMGKSPGFGPRPVERPSPFE